MPETPEAAARAAQEKAAKWRKDLFAMHADDLDELQKMPVQRREHGTRLLKALRRQILIDQLTGASKLEPQPEPEARSEADLLLERLGREEDETPEVGTASVNGKTGEGAAPIPAPARATTRARVTIPASLDEAMRQLSRIVIGRDVDALAEFEAAELAGAKRADLLEVIADVRKQHERKSNTSPSPKSDPRNASSPSAAVEPSSREP